MVYVIRKFHAIKFHKKLSEKCLKSGCMQFYQESNKKHLLFLGLDLCKKVAIFDHKTIPRTSPLIPHAASLGVIAYSPHG